MKKYLFVLFLLTSPLLLRASFTYNSNCKEAFNYLISLRFNEAQRLIALEKSANPENAIPVFLENYIDFLESFIGEEENSFRHYTAEMAIRKRRIESENSSSPYYKYCLATMDMQVAFTRMKFGEYVKAAAEINRAYRLLERNNHDYPDFIPQKLSLGMLHTLIGSIPDKYDWIRKAVGLKGSVNGGIQEMQHVFEISQDTPKWKYLQNETLFLLSLTSVNLAADKSFADKILNWYNKEEGLELVRENPLMAYCKANICFKKGLNDQGIQILTFRPKGPKFFPFHYLDYLLGVAKLNRLDNDAWAYLINFTANFKGRNFIKSAYQHIAWNYLINGDVKKYAEYMNRIPLAGDKITDSDKKALSDSRTSEMPDVHLLKAQLLFDGGYYERALEELAAFNRSPIKSEHHSLEYLYRLARVYHETGKLSEAIRYYNLTIEKGQDKPWYFAANAALQMGNIYETQKKFILARSYYEKCLTMNPTEYKNSISQKAEAGLSRLN
ncbi:MAG: tetratricopeptide repeat protein [Bacteroidota bacterium]|nr:tetratricopeptide repeat protein [Bacteroidota bacterium]